MQGPEESKAMTETLDLEGKSFCLEHAGTSACPALVKERNARIDRGSLRANGSWQMSSLSSNTFPATDLEQSAFAHLCTLWYRKVLLETEHRVILYIFMVSSSKGKKSWGQWLQRAGTLA